MRRFASVFTSKRDKPDDNSAPTRSQSLLPALALSKKNIKRAHTVNLNQPVTVPAQPTTPITPTINSTPSTPQLSSGSDPAHSSSSSSGSASLRTPDDDPQLLSRTSTKKSWRSWLGGKKSGTLKQSNQPEEWDRPIPEWQTLPAPILRPPPSGNRITQPAEETEEETSSESDDDSVSVSHPVAPLAANIPATPTTIAQSRKNLQILIQNSLVPPLSPSPFAHSPGNPMFPRSCNPSCSLPRQETMRVNMHKTHLLRRLQHPTRPLTRPDELSILPFSSRPTPTPINLTLPQFDIMAVPKETKVSSSSPGVGRWISRSCFEDRFVVWITANGSIARKPVAGTSFAVLDLEFSEGLEAMAGFNLEVVVPEKLGEPTGASDEPETPSSASSSSSQLSIPTHARNSPYIAVPSPLRNQHNPMSISPATSTGGPSEATVPLVAPPATTVKRGVRFVEDDKDDQIPLGYALRLKKRREEKAKFLRQEQERRAFEEEKAKLEEERRRRDRERNEWEKERRAWEKEKMAMEEERKQRLYAEEVAAARLRRESQRVGGVPGSVSSGSTAGMLLAASASSTSLREVERNRAHESKRYSRPLYDSPQNPRKQASEPAALNLSGTPSPPSVSPGSSRPPSVDYPTAPSQRSSSQIHSRPPSLNSTSSEDIRQQNSVSNRKRNSIVSMSSSRPGSDRALSYPVPAWPATNQSLLIPPVPPVPPFVMDMPLLPPTPPFMLQQYPRPRSRHSASPSSSSSPSRQRPPSNASSERVNVQQQQQQQQRRQSAQSSHSHSSSSHRPQYHSSPSTPSSSPHRPDYQQRRASGDMSASRRTSSGLSISSSAPQPPPQAYDRGRPQPSSYSLAPRSQSSSVSRGRPAQPATQLQTPNPWTALPTEHGRLPMAMPTYSNTRPSPGRRQTAIS